MLKNHLKIAVRSLVRQKSFSLINILGLVVGLACSLLILLWVQHQYSFDNFHSRADNIFQVSCNSDYGQGLQTWSGVPYPYSQSLNKDFPEVENVIVKTYSNEKYFQVDNKKTSEIGFYANENFFRVFDFPILQGNPNELLNTPDKIVVSEKLAKKFFGNFWQAAIGNTITVDETPFQISGILADVPANSSFQFDYILPFKKHLEEFPWIVDKYGDFNYSIYVQLKEKADKEALIDKFLNKLATTVAGSVYANSIPEGLNLQPIKNVYLYNKFENGKVAGGRITYVRLFFLAALFILFLAGINYMNLATARASKKAKEIGIRKTIGASRGSLMMQFFTEAMVMTGAAIAIAVIAVQLLLPWFNQLVDTSVSVQLTKPSFWILITSVFVGLSLLSGIYPAMLLSSFNVSKVIKGQLGNHLSTITLRKGLVVFQFLISALLIIGAVTMRQQLNYLQTKDIGLERGNVIVIDANDQLVENYKVFKDQLEQNPNIEIVSASSDSPIDVGSSTGDPTWEGFTEDKRTIFKRIVTDYNFVECMKIPLVAGRFPDANRKADSIGIIVNETTIRVMEVDDPIGKTLTFWGEDWPIVGVVKDFHLSSLHSTISPLIIVNGNNWMNEIYVRPAGPTKDAIAAISKVHAELASAYPFEYTFLDKQYEEMYKLEETTGALADLFAIIALFISALGLLGLAAFSAERRLKEVGIRKVLGASVPNLVALLSKDFLKLVFLALLIAIPVGWYGMNQFLENYSYHIDIDWTVFAIMIGAALLVASLTVGIQAFRAAITNPIDTIKTE